MRVGGEPLAVPGWRRWLWAAAAVGIARAAVEKELGYKMVVELQE